MMSTIADILSLLRYFNKNKKCQPIVALEEKTGPQSSGQTDQATYRHCQPFIFGGTAVMA